MIDSDEMNEDSMLNENYRKMGRRYLLEPETDTTGSKFSEGSDQSTESGEVEQLVAELKELENKRKSKKENIMNTYQQLYHKASTFQTEIQRIEQEMESQKFMESLSKIDLNVDDYHKIYEVEEKVDKEEDIEFSDGELELMENLYGNIEIENEIDQQIEQLLRNSEEDLMYNEDQKEFTALKRLRRKLYMDMDKEYSETFLKEVKRVAQRGRRRKEIDLTLVDHPENFNVSYENIWEVMCPTELDREQKVLFLKKLDHMLSLDNKQI